MLKEIVVILPFFVSLFWSLILYIELKRDEIAKRVLLSFMITATLLYACHLVYFSVGYSLYRYFNSLYLFSNLAVFPLFYIYVSTLSKEKANIRARIWLFLPAIIIPFLVLIIHLIAPSYEVNDFIRRYLYNENIDYNHTIFSSLLLILHQLSRYIFAIYLIVSVYLGWKELQEYESHICQFYSSNKDRSLKWVKGILVSMVVAAFLGMVLNFLGRSFFTHNSALLAIPSLLFSAIFFSIGYLGNKQSFSIEDYKYDTQTKEEENKRECEPENFVYNNETRSKLYNQICQLFEEKQIYKNPDLKITDISFLLKTNRTYISGVINSNFNCSFCDLVNGYRVEYSKKLLLDQNLYILQYIAIESGFASVNTFMRAFKKMTGLTPGEYRRKYISNN